MDLFTSLYSAGFPATLLFFEAISSSIRSFLSVGEDTMTGGVVSANDGRDLRLEAVDLLQTLGWAAGSPSTRTWKR